VEEDTPKEEENSPFPHTLLPLFFWLSSRRDLLLSLPFLDPTIIVISPEAMDSLIVHRAVERPPHFAFDFAFAVAFLAYHPRRGSVAQHLGKPSLQAWPSLRAEEERGFSPGVCLFSRNQKLERLSQTADFKPVKPPNHVSPYKQTRSTWHINFSQPAILNKEQKSPGPPGHSYLE
jgi:hypothetical protein